MASRRLPGKVLQVVEGRPLLDWQLARLRRCATADDIWIATSQRPDDDAIADWARRGDVPCFRGSADDVLARYVGVARAARADVVVRVTADCPLIEPQVVDAVVNELNDHQACCDYASNVLERTFPRGLDAEALFFDALLRADRLSRSPASREHVTLAVRSEFPQAFLTRSVRDQVDNSDLRWTVDLPADLELMRRLYAELPLVDPAFTYRELVAAVRARPELSLINAAAETWDPLAAELESPSRDGAAS